MLVGRRTNASIMWIVVVILLLALSYIFVRARELHHDLVPTNAPLHAPK
jgi:hypothetical protein